MNTFTAVAYLVTSIFFILGVMRLRLPQTARSGNMLAAVGMIIALVATAIQNPRYFSVPMLLATAVAAVIGVYMAKKVRMTAMPQMVAVFNGMGGGAAALVSVGEIFWGASATHVAGALIPAMFTVVVGLISFSGSIIAFLKLQEWISGRPITYGGQKIVNGLIFAAVVVMALDLIVRGPQGQGSIVVLVVAGALVMGISIVLPIGGADMPVVISLLNAFTGLAAAATGFLLGNNVLIIAGAMVGASGTILTRLMSRAMNRPLQNILFGAFGQVSAGGAPAVSAQGTVQQATVEDVAMMLAYAQRVVVVPGYGLAVARAQQEARQVMEKLEKRGVVVQFGIHPVAGRMPGHMNVLLAEANIPYDRLKEMDEINPEFPQTDVVLVVGANDVTNPAARTQPNSPLYGMPILNVDQAQKVVVIKRGMNPGFAGIDNPLYVNPKTSMMFGDAREALAELAKEMDAV